MKVIDSHVHIGLNSFCNSEERLLPYDLENRYNDYINVMRQADVERACILPIPDIGYDATLSNNYLKEAFEYSNGMLLPICRLNDTLADNLNSCFLGAKYHRVYEKFTAATIKEYYKILEYYEMPLIIHAAFKDKIKQVKEIKKLAPKLKIVLAHMGRGHIYTSEGVIDNIRGLKDFDDVYFETSTVGNAKTIEEAVKLIGESRIIFGSDYPFGKIYLKDKYNYMDEIDVILNAQINESQKEKILYDNAYDLFSFKTFEKKSYVSKCQNRFQKDLLEGLNNISVQDKKFLAYDNKEKLIKSCIKTNRHIYVIVCGDKIAGYFRESGRPGGYSMLEELLVFDGFKGQGLSKVAMQFYISLFPCSLAKTNSKNIIMNNLLVKYGYRLVKGKNIYEWEK